MATKLEKVQAKIDETEDRADTLLHRVAASSWSAVLMVLYSAACLGIGFLLGRITG